MGSLTSCLFCGSCKGTRCTLVLGQGDTNVVKYIYIDLTKDTVHTMLKNNCPCASPKEIESKLPPNYEKECFKNYTQLSITSGDKCIIISLIDNVFNKDKILSEYNIFSMDQYEKIKFAFS